MKTNGKVAQIHQRAANVMFPVLHSGDPISKRLRLITAIIHFNARITRGGYLRLNLKDEHSDNPREVSPNRAFFTEIVEHEVRCFA